MPTTPIIQSSGSTSGPGTAGQGRNNLVAGETVTLSDTVAANVGASYAWAFEDAPIDTSPTLTDPLTPTPTFVVDPSTTKAGSYRIRCTVNGLFSSVIVIAVPLANTGARIPSFEEELEYNGGGNTKGWHESQTRWMRAVDATAGGGGSSAVIFDDSVPSAKVNIRSDRASNQSVIDNTQAQITNFGSQDGLWNGGATGATGVASTIGGGDDNSAGPAGYETVGGGAGNTATSDSATVGGGFDNAATSNGAAVGGGYHNTASDDTAVVAGGDGNTASGESSAILGGEDNAAVGDHSVLCGGGENTVEGQYSSVVGGNNNNTFDDYTFIGGGSNHEVEVEGGSILGGTSNYVGGNNGAVLGGSDNQATGDNAAAEGSSTIAEGFASHAEGSDTHASGDYSHSEGQGTQAQGTASHAEGETTTASATSSHAEGNGSQATELYAHAEGNSTVASGNASHAEGFSCQATAASAHAEGESSDAGGHASHAEGLSTTASAEGAHSEGSSTTASGTASHAQGIGAQATRTGQDAHACGMFSTLGDAQVGSIVLRGSTPGIGVSESVELLYGSSEQLILENGKTYTFRVVAVAGGSQAGPVRKSRGFELSFNVRRDAGLSVITGSGVGGSYGDAATADWAMVASVGAAPDRIVITFTTGAIATLAKVVANVEFAEAAY